MDDPVVTGLVVAALGLVVLVIVARIWQRRREAAYYARRREELRKRRGALHLRQQEIERLAARIVATSSTGNIAGFEIVRQIEAVFADGQPAPSKAVEVLKALVAEKGANAIINLRSVRLPDGKCLAQGDAVVVKPLDLVPDEAAVAEPEESAELTTDSETDAP